MKFKITLNEDIDNALVFANKQKDLKIEQDNDYWRKTSIVRFIVKFTNGIIVAYITLDKNQTTIEFTGSIPLSYTDLDVLSKFIKLLKK